MADFLSDKRAEIDSRLKELRPLHEEYLKLERAKQALDGLDEPRRGPGRPAGSGTKSGSGSGSGSSSGSRNGRRRRRAGGTAAEHALAAVRQNPGITVAELAPKLGIKHKNYLYRVMSGLQEEGALRKDGRGYHAS
jgi:hypothetical protein